MKTALTAILILALASCSSRQEKNGNSEATVDSKTNAQKASWVNFDYQQVRVYFTRTPFLGYKSAIVAEGKLIDSVWDKEGVKLSPEQVQRLDKILQQPDRDVAVADCFNPRHGIVFWDKNNKPVAHISVCFECNLLKATPELYKYDLTDIKQLFLELGMPVFEDPTKYEAYFEKLMSKDAR
jgi:hypothetical protein